MADTSDLVSVDRVALMVLLNAVAGTTDPLVAGAAAKLGGGRPASSGWFGARPIGMVDADHDKTCRWSRSPNGSYTCAHGIVTRVHPAGWCNGGCCR